MSNVKTRRAFPKGTQGVCGVVSLIDYNVRDLVLSRRHTRLHPVYMLLQSDRALKSLSFK